MGQVTSGVRAALSHPLVYSAFQSMMGGRAIRRALVSDHMHPEIGMKVLDIGCGPAGILEYLPDVDYWGFDVSSAYIESARAKFGTRGRFVCRQFSLSDLEGFQRFDLVLALGLIHHLGDEDALALFRLAHEALRPGGRFVSIDPCLEPGQNPVARFLIRRDRGQNVRSRNGYELLAKDVFSDLIINVRHTAWIPYTHCIMECKR